MLALPGTFTRPVFHRLREWKLLRRPAFMFGLLLALAAALCPWRAGVVNGQSMEPTLRNLSFFVFDRTYYRDRSPRPGEIVVIQDRQGIWIKRIYAAGGDVFLCWSEPRDGFIRHDPIAQDQREYFTGLAADQRRKGVGNCQVVRVKVPKDCLFVIGDAAVSEDSRNRGYVRAENVLGRVIPLPGQDLGTIPNWVELSSPRANKRTLVAKN